MATRLNVIMVESAPDSGAARRMAESVVGELIGLPGIDLILVDRLETLEPTSTDKLTLDGITGDVCVLDWRAPGAIVSSLQSIGFHGQRSPHQYDSDTIKSSMSQSDGPTRRIYAFDLSRFANVSQLCEALTALRATRDVRTFSLGNPAAAPVTPVPPVKTGAPDGTADSGTADSDRPPVVASSVPQPNREPNGSEATSHRVLGPPQPERDTANSLDEASSRESTSGSRRPSATDLDDLVDQLDQFDS